MTDPHITSLEQLRSLYRQPLESSVRKESLVINTPYRKLIEAAPFCAIASHGPEGLDCSPRGDAGTVVRVLDDKTVALPDRRGNNRLDTLQNIIHDSRVALLLLIPGLNECVRINGEATLSLDPDLKTQFAVSGKAPICVIVIKVQTVYFQCARAIKRAALWDQKNHADPTALPSAGQLIKSVLADFDQAQYDENLPDRQANTLY